MDLEGDGGVFRLLAESPREYALGLLDPDGRVTSWSAALTRMLGWPKEEVLGRHIEMFFTPDDAASGTARELLRGARARGSSREQLWWVRSDQERFWADVTMDALHFEGELVGFSLLLRDETVSKRDADKIRFLADTGAVLAETLDLRESCTRVVELAVPTIADWAVVDVLRSGRLERLAWAHVDPARARPGAQFVRDYPPTRGKEHGVFAVLDSGRGLLVPHIPDEQLVHIARSREHLALLRTLGLSSWMCVPLVAHGRVLGAMTFVMAESGRTFDESDLTFATEVAKRAGLTLDNARLYDDAKRALKAREEFLAVASHELRTPLTPLRLQLDALARTLSTADGESERQQMRKIGVMRRQVDRLARLVESLLAVTRGAPVELTARELADLSDIAHDVVERMQERAAQLGTRIRFQARGTVLGRFDARAIEIVLEHLVDNALKYGDGAPVEVAVERSGGCGIVRVSDLGIGIEAADHERIFEKFERSVSADHYGGLGLGLFIARALVDGHGGRLRVESEPGRGAVFIVELPLGETAREERAGGEGGAP